MLRSYFKIAYRNIVRNKVFSIINVLGLALGITSFIFILEYIGSEQQVNQFHQSIDRIYRVTNLDKNGNSWIEVAPGWGKLAQEKFPEIESYCRFADGIASGIVQNQADGISFREENISYVEGNFFEFFSFPLVQGSSIDFNQPYAVFLSEIAAKKYFGDGAVIGKSLRLNNQFGSLDYTVKGVFEDIGDNSDIDFDIVFSLETLKNSANLNGNGWANLDNIDSGFMHLYIMTKPNVAKAVIETKMIALVNELNPENDGVEPRLQPLKYLHLPESLESSYPVTGSLKYIYILGGIAFLIILIAWLNYINLSTASSMKRATEVGIKKAIGAMRSQVITQFIIETLLMNTLSFLLAFGLILLLQPYFNELVGREMSLNAILQSPIIIVGLLTILVGSLLSGSYTAFVISGFNPVESLKGRLTKRFGTQTVRRGLVVFQFTISVTLILATIIIYRQIQFMKSENLGFTQDQVMVINGPQVGQDSTYANRKVAFNAFLKQQSFVKSFATSGSVPGKFYSFKTSGFTHAASQPDDEFKSYSFLIVDNNYFPTYEIGITAGRNFIAAEANVEWNDNNKVIINEKAVEKMGFKSAQNAITNGIQWDERHLDIIGVTADYHHVSLHNPIDAMIFYPQNSNVCYSVRLTPQDLSSKITQIETAYQQAFPGNPFDFTFTDDTFAKSYAEEEQFSQLFTTASLLAIFIACLGLFGLTTFTVEQRRKEIGLRKVLGASVLSVVRLLSVDFMKLVGIAILIGVPVAWYVMQSWLQNFAFHVDIEWWLGVIAAAVVTGVALLTVGYHSLKTSLMNPVDSLRND